MYCILRVTFTVIILFTTNVVGASFSNSPLKSDATGTIFSGKKVQKFIGALHFQNDKRARKNVNPNSIFPIFSKDCKNWAVVTTINHATNSVKRVASLVSWCLVIVGDKQTPPAFMNASGLLGNDNVVFLSSEDQQSIRNSFVQSIPYRSFARKNIGYLFAIKHGAKTIFDFDDDNLLLPKNGRAGGFSSPIGSMVSKRASQKIMVRYLSSTEKSIKVFNPHPLMNTSVENTWPRGFPLSQVLNRSSSGSGRNVFVGAVPRSSVAVLQYVSDGDPDVDAIFRLTRQLPFTFNSQTRAQKLLIPKQAYTPYNAQSTVHFYNAFWGMLLPHSVPGRVSDIWRAYIAQRIFKDLHLEVIYAPPLVFHDRAPHNYMADYQAENYLYTKTDALLTFLHNWDHSSDNLLSRIEMLWVTLYEHDFIGYKDVLSLQSWLLALIEVKYTFPKLPTVPWQDPVPQGELHSQPYMTTPAFNFGGPFGNATYLEFAKTDYGLKSMLEVWEMWMSSKITTNERPKETIIKIILITKNEWPLLRQWTIYHGELIGFEHLYILDGSTDSRCTSFLVNVRDHLGVNVIFTPTNLNGLNTEITKIARNISVASDAILKLDTDEFLGIITKDSKCKVRNHTSCPLSPYGVRELLQKSVDLEGHIKGHLMNVSFLCLPSEVKKVCQAHGKDDISLFSLVCGKVGSRYAENFPHAAYKAVYDSRTLWSIQIGGHVEILPTPNGNYLKGVIAPFDSLPTERPFPLGIFHFHVRCVKEMVSKARDILVYHGYIDNSDTETKVLETYKALFPGKNLCSLSWDDLSSINVKLSYHRMLYYLRYLAGCDVSNYDDDYLAQHGIAGIGSPNADFRQFMLDAMKMHYPISLSASGSDNHRVYPAPHASFSGHCVEYNTTHGK